MSHAVYRSFAVLARSIALATLLSGGWPVIASAEEMGEDSADDDELIARLPVCYGFGCARSTQVHLYRSDLDDIESLLRGSASAGDERNRLSRAVALMETVVAERTPTGSDLPRNDYDEARGEGQMDCVDESSNTSAYLRLFERRGLLRWHDVLEPAYRAPRLLDQHWSAQIEEREGRRRFAVDSWVRASGEPAVVQSLEAWKQDLPPS